MLPVIEHESENKMESENVIGKSVNVNVNNEAVKASISPVKSASPHAQSNKSISVPAEVNWLTFAGNRNGAGQPHGEGKVSFVDGTIYEGEFNNGEISG